jgi:hypothetical protein
MPDCRVCHFRKQRSFIDSKLYTVQRSFFSHFPFPSRSYNSFPILAAFPAHLTFLYFSAPMKLCYLRKPRKLLLGDIIKCSRAFSFLCPDIFMRTFFQTLVLIFFPSNRPRFSPIKNGWQSYSLHFLIFIVSEKRWEKIFELNDRHSQNFKRNHESVSYLRNVGF